MEFTKIRLLILSFILLLFSHISLAQGRYSETKNNYTGNSNVRWINPVRGIPANAVVGDIQNGKKLYVARGFYKGQYHPGKTADNWGACIIGYNGKEVRIIDYQILAFIEGKNEIALIGDESNRKLLNILYEISDELKKDEYGIFVQTDMLKQIKSKFVLMRKAAIKKQDKLLAKKIDKIIDSLNGAFVKIEELKKEVDKLEEML